MARTRTSPISQLRTAIDCLPVDTRIAMLDGVRQNRIIVGAYTDKGGGVCPMLAAHRSGGRTSFIGFARAWDRFAKAGHKSRDATRREVRVLVAQLEASLLAEEHVDLRGAIAEHHHLLHESERRAARLAPAPAAPARVRPGDPDRSKELGKKAGWSWLRPFRRLDEFEAALAALEAEHAELVASAPDRAELLGVEERELVLN